MKIKTLGHACFLMTTQQGTRIVTDPFEDSIGYPEPRMKADIVTASHGHFDHGNVQAVDAKHAVRDGDARDILDVHLYGVDTKHDDAQGAKRGENTVFVFEADGLRIAHLGDLGHFLSKEQVAAIGPLDVLMIPVGGTYTLDAQEAHMVVQALSPRMVIPMHYQTGRLTLSAQLLPPEAFTELFVMVTDTGSDTLTVEKDDGQSGVFLLTYEGEKGA